MSVWVPELGDNRLAWHPCADMPYPLIAERVSGCRAVPAMLRTQGALMGRLLKRGRYHGFRVLATDGTTGELVGFSEWYVSPETGAYLPFGGDWSACDYGQHEHHQHDQDDTEQPAASLAA
ncbi:hypothetical protein GCM10010289_82240 [Streptomyces violascens]|uniref:Acetyltransferase n=2 Tax=Streptomyces violascens TaxID=67381 RepID=A0ABQ3QQW9_9ACTN|nr:hypothetical protein GCM10010289_82240 [Streptomyces violascens]GHI39650.1 hypothetical protein Sviol_40580 [Streptomyces violascens]